MAKEIEGVGPYDDEPDCKFNSGVGCDEQDRCATCGWNPEVAEARKRGV